MAKNYLEVEKEAGKEVSFTFADLEKTPDDFIEWLECGDKGVPFEFFDEETFTLPAFEKIKIWGRREKIGKKYYPVLYTAVNCSRQGYMEMPLSILRRLPALKEEIELLKKDNKLGVSLIGKQSDIKRLTKLAKAAGTNPIRVTAIVLHKNDFIDGKVIKDDPSKEEKDRVQITCYKYNPVQ